MEKKLTDEEIIKAYKSCFIDRADCDTCPCDDWGCGVDGSDILKLINRQKAKIERLTEERDLYKNQFNELEPRFFDLRYEKDELQKQVDELTDKLGKVLLGVKADELLVAKGVEQAEKDTAKEIFTDLLKEFSIRKSCGNADVVVREMAQRKGVEVQNG